MAGNPNWVRGGPSPNASGRPAITKEFREKCQQWAMEAGGFEKLVGIAEGRGDPKFQLAAITFMMDQAFGKAVTQIAGADEDFSKLRIIIDRPYRGSDAENTDAKT